MDEPIITTILNEIDAPTSPTASEVTTSEAAPTGEITESIGTDNDIIIQKFDTIIAYQQSIFDYIVLFFAIFIVGICIRFLWTVISKWFFGGV